MPPENQQENLPRKPGVLMDFGLSFFDFLATVVTKGWLLILIVAILLTVISANFAQRLTFDTSIMALLPSDDPAVVDVQEISKLFGKENELIAVVNLDEGIPEELAKEFMDKFASLLMKSPLLEGVEYKLPTLAFKEEARRLEDKLSIVYLFYATPEKDAYLMFLSPTNREESPEFATRLLKAVRDIEYQARKDVHGNVTGLSVTYTGSYVIALEELKAMTRNIRVTALTSIGCALLLFALAFKRVITAIWVGLTLGMALLWTVLIAFMALGSLNLMTVAFAAILAGLGIDFGIHLSNRFLFELSVQEDPYKAIRTTLVTTGDGILFSCLTTALAFYSLLLTDFDGAAQFGFLVGTGIILCTVAMLLVLPSFLLMGAIVIRRRPMLVDSPGLGTIATVMEKHGSNIAMILILLLGAFHFYIFSKNNFPEFDNRLDSMVFQENRAFAALNDARERFGNYFEHLSLVAKSKDPDEAIRLLHTTVPGIEELTNNGRLMRFEYIFKYLPSADKRKMIVKAVTRRGRPDRTLKYLMKKLKRTPAKEEEYEILLREKKEILHLLRSDLSLESFTYEELKKTLPSVLFDKFFARDRVTGDYLSVCYMYPTKTISEEEDIRELCVALNVDGRRLRMAGMSLMRGKLERLIQRQFKVITVCIAIVLAAMLFLICRRINLVIVSVIPLLMSLVTTISFMVLYDLKLNYMNIVAFPLILGMGIDNSIHMLYRYFESDTRSVRSTVGQAGKAILVTSLTTISGFGSLLLTKHNGLVSLGLITSVGIGACLLTSLFVLPGLLILFAPPGSKDPAPEDPGADAPSTQA